MSMSASSQTVLFARMELFALSQMVATIATAHKVTSPVMTNMNLVVYVLGVCLTVMTESVCNIFNTWKIKDVKC